MKEKKKRKGNTNRFAQIRNGRTRFLPAAGATFLTAFYSFPCQRLAIADSARARDFSLHFERCELRPRKIVAFSILEFRLSRANHVSFVLIPRPDSNNRFLILGVSRASVIRRESPIFSVKFVYTRYFIQRKREREREKLEISKKKS